MVAKGPQMAQRESMDQIQTLEQVGRREKEKRKEKLSIVGSPPMDEKRLKKEKKNWRLCEVCKALETPPDTGGHK